MTIDYRWAEGHSDLLPALAADLVRSHVAVITGLNSTAAVLAAKAASTTIPIVFSIGGDPVKFGLVASFNRPGGNVTGVSYQVNALGPKRLGLLRELRPDATEFTVLANPSNPNAGPDTNDLQAAASSIGLALNVINATSEREIDAFFATLVQQQASAFLPLADPLFNDRRKQIVALATRHAIPAIHFLREFTEIGGLMSYGPDLAEGYRQAGIYTGRILKGEKAADLPVIQPTKFEFVINLKTVRSLGLNVPPSLLARADEVIE